MDAFSAMDNNSGGDNSIAAVAARIQERALQLASERAAVELVKAEVDEIQPLLDREIKKNGAVRCTLLSTVRSRHGVELELWKVREQQEARLAKLDEYQRETEEAKAQANELQQTWEDDIQQVYVDHHLQRELYRRSVEARIQRREQQIKDRDQRLSQLERESREFAAETKLMVEETKALESNILSIDDREETEDEEVATLAMQIRATVAKRTSLRRAVQDAEKACQKANEEMMKWEQERMGMAR